MTQTELELGLRLKWITHDPLGVEPTLECRFWWNKPLNIQAKDVVEFDAEGNEITVQYPWAEEFDTEVIGETFWQGTNDFGPLWAAIEAKKAELKTDN